MEKFKDAVFWRLLGRLVISYVVAGGVSIMAISTIQGPPHPHAYIAQFPSYLIFSPIVPYLLLHELALGRANDLMVLGLLIFALAWPAAFILLTWMSRRKKN